MAAKAKARTTPASTVSGLRAVAGLVGELPDESHRLVSERIRLGMLSALLAGERLSFAELKRILATTDGNLSVHARKLEEAGYVACHKGFEGRVPRTEYVLTAAGRRALVRYLDHMEALIRATRR